MCNFIRENFKWGEKSFLEIAVRLLDQHMPGEFIRWCRAIEIQHVSPLNNERCEQASARTAIFQTVNEL